MAIGAPPEVEGPREDVDPFAVLELLGDDGPEDDLPDDDLPDDDVPEGDLPEDDVPEGDFEPVVDDGPPGPVVALPGAPGLDPGVPAAELDDEGLEPDFGFGDGFAGGLDLAGGLGAAGGFGATAGFGRVGATRGGASPELRVKDQPSNPPRIAV